MFKNNLLFTRRLDNAYLFGILLTVTSIIEKLISQKEFITILISFVLVIFICFLGSILMVTKSTYPLLKVVGMNLA